MAGTYGSACGEFGSAAAGFRPGKCDDRRRVSTARRLPDLPDLADLADDLSDLADLADEERRRLPAARRHLPARRLAAPSLQQSLRPYAEM